MTDKASPDASDDVTRFLQYWAELWTGELRAQARDPEAMAGGLEMWRTAMSAMSVWASAMGVTPGERAGAPRTEAAVAASDPRDAAIERLARRVDELESRLARLEEPRLEEPGRARS